jgi:DNA-binding protein H-NS
MAAKDLEKMSQRELEDVIQRAQALKAATRDRARQELRSAIDAMLTEHGFSINEVYPTRGGGRKSAGGSVVRYRNPENTVQTWTGRGRKPNWLVDAIGKGAKIEKFEIT